MIYSEFYSELGKLLYAVADIDGFISQKEKRKLKEIVRRELVPEEKHADDYGNDAAFYTEMEFDFLDENMSNPEAAFESFIDFVSEHHTAFDEKMKNVCIRIAKELAYEYRATNKKEKQLIEKLRMELDKITFNRTAHDNDLL